LKFMNAQKVDKHEAEIEKTKSVFHAILRDIKSDLDSGGQPGETATAAMLQSIPNTTAEQMQELHVVDDVTAMLAGQVRQLVPMDEETAEQFRQLMKKRIVQEGNEHEV
jgi:hypothetical protein